MEAVTKQRDWKSFLRFFSDQNQGRVTRIGVFEGEPGSMTDYWIESGLPLMGIEIEDRDGTFTVEIMLGVGGGQTPAGSRHFTHTVKNAQDFIIYITVNGEGEGIDIKDSEGRTSVLRFEN